MQSGVSVSPEDTLTLSTEELVIETGTLLDDSMAALPAEPYQVFF